MDLELMILAHCI